MKEFKFRDKSLCILICYRNIKFVLQILKNIVKESLICQINYNKTKEEFKDEKQNERTKGYNPNSANNNNNSNAYISSGNNKYGSKPEDYLQTQKQEQMQHKKRQIKNC